MVSEGTLPSPCDITKGLLPELNAFSSLSEQRGEPRRLSFGENNNLAIKLNGKAFCRRVVCNYDA